MTEKDVGVLEEFDWNGSMYSDCGPSADSFWTMVLGISADGSSSEDWNQIDQNGSNIWRFYTHFSARPENMITDDCQYDDPDFYKPDPEYFTYNIEIGDNEDEGQLSFGSWEPQDEQGDAGIIGFIMDIVGGVGGIFTTVGNAVVDFVIESGRTTDVSPSNLDSKITFEVPLGGDSYDDLPREIRNSSGQTTDVTTTQVRVSIENEYPSGSHDIVFNPHYTFHYHKMDEYNCYCDQAYLQSLYKTTAPTQNGVGTFSVAQD